MLRRFLFYFVGAILVGTFGAGNLGAAHKKKSSTASADAVYTGTTNSAAASEPDSSPASSESKSSHSHPATNAPASEPPLVSTNSISKPKSPPASTNVPQVEPSSPATLISTNEVAKPSVPPTSTNAVAATPPAPVIHVATLTTADLKEFADQSPAVQALIMHGLELTRMNLKYQYGSDDPKNGGMDCSGTVYYLLKEAGLDDVPRDASGLYSWVWKKVGVESVVSSNPDTFELSHLKPGDLLFWIGTYDVQHDPPISHVMIYLGTNRETGKRVMVGASEGRRYKGKSQYGVSVFDFELPKAPFKIEPGSKREYEGRFVGYGGIPGL